MCNGDPACASCGCSNNPPNASTNPTDPWCNIVYRLPDGSFLAPAHIAAQCRLPPGEAPIPTNLPACWRPPELQGFAEPPPGSIWTVQPGVPFPPHPSTSQTSVQAATQISFGSAVPSFESAPPPYQSAVPLPPSNPMQNRILPASNTSFVPQPVISPEAYYRDPPGTFVVPAITSRSHHSTSGKSSSSRDPHGAFIVPASSSRSHHGTSGRSRSRFGSSSFPQHLHAQLPPQGQPGSHIIHSADGRTFRRDPSGGWREVRKDRDFVMPKRK